MILAGDIGGTKTLIGLFDAATLRFERRYPSRDFVSFDALLARALGDADDALGGAVAIDRACFGVAGPVTGGRVEVTNLPWTLDAAALADRLAVRHLRLMNDFEASAHGVDALAAADLATLQEGAPVQRAARVLIGAGTGLGVAYLVHDGARYQAVAGEGGHAAFAPADETQAALWSSLRARFRRVEAEHVVSGPGLEHIYEHLRASATHAASADPEPEDAASAAAIARAALERGEPLAGAALDLFVRCYGAVAGDHALNVVARGGVYIAGGIAPKILPRLADGPFLDAFNDKGTFSELTRSMPVHVVLNERLGLLGAMRVAASL